MQHILDDLESYNEWATEKIFRLCEGLTDDELDQSREMGFGSLRATLFHIYAAEQIWLERWQSQPWRSFQTDPEGMSPSTIRSRLRDTAKLRREVIDKHRAEQWQTVISFQDSKQTPFERRLLGLLLHVAVHGIHHRAQALHFLKRLGRTIPGGIDYIFYRLACTTLEQPSQTIENIRKFGLQALEWKGEDIAWDRPIILKLFRYQDWANARIMEMLEGLTDPQLDRDFEMGPGSIRKTLLHMHDAELWWLENWTLGNRKFPHSPPETSLSDWQKQFLKVSDRRNAFLSELSEDDAQRVVAIDGGGGESRFRIVESVIQLLGHGVHHRAQLINMLRHSGVAVRNIDLLYAPPEVVES